MKTRNSCRTALACAALLSFAACESPGGFAGLLGGDTSGAAVVQNSLQDCPEVDVPGMLVARVGSVHTNAAANTESVQLNLTAKGTVMLAPANMSGPKMASGEAFSVSLVRAKEGDFRVELHQGDRTTDVTASVRRGGIGEVAKDQITFRPVAGATNSDATFELIVPVGDHTVAIPFH